MLQVSELGEAANGLRHYTFATRELTSADDASTLDIPAGVEVKGLVSVLANGKVRPVVAQVTFVPKLGESEPLATPRIANSTASSQDGSNFSVILAPERQYSVSIYPLGADSALLPPVQTTFASERNAKFKYQYKDLSSFNGVLVDERGTRQAGRWLRIHAGAPSNAPENDPYHPDDVVSSLVVTGEDGSFSLSVLPDVLGARAFVLEVSLFDSSPWGTTIELQADRVMLAMSSNRLVIPEVPAQVELRESVETEPPPDDPTGGTRLPNTAVTFVSSFPVPAGEGAVKDRDWCRAKTLGDMLSPFACKSRVTTTADVLGKYSAELLPGDYELYLSPSSDTVISRNRLTTASVASVETQAGGAPQSGQVRELPLALRGDGVVLDGHGRPIENAGVHMLPLKVVLPPEAANTDAGTVDPEGKVGLFNRTSDAVSSASGEFAFPVDRGVFDFVVRPPDDSGYAWFVKPNRKVTEGYHTHAFSLPAPVILAGVVTSGGKPVALARVDAYTFVRDPATAIGKRALLIASTQSDAEGNYTLKLPWSVAE
jgi:hypothetical protein